MEKQNTSDKKKTKVEGLTLPNFKTYSKATFIKAKDRHIDQWNTIEKPEIDLQKYNQLIFGKGAKVIPWRKGPFQQTEHPYAKSTRSNSNSVSFL